MCRWGGLGRLLRACGGGVSFLFGEWRGLGFGERKGRGIGGVGLSMVLGLGGEGGAYQVVMPMEETTNFWSNKSLSTILL